MKLKGYEAQCLVEREYEGRLLDELERAEYDFDAEVKNAYWNKYILRKVKQ